MKINEVVMLSDLADDEIVSYKGANYTITVGELKEELKTTNYLSKKWYVVKSQTWNPDASKVLEGYIKNEYRGMYEGWDDKAKECVTDDLVRKIQSILDEGFKSPSVKNYWKLDKLIYI